MQPYYAIKKILDDLQQGLFEANDVRNLLRTVSLFPIGSFVALNDQRVGRVIRSNGDHYDRPVVELWESDAQDSEPTVVDLAQNPDLMVVRPLTGSV